MLRIIEQNVTSGGRQNLSLFRARRQKAVVDVTWPQCFDRLEACNFGHLDLFLVTQHNRDYLS